MSEWKGPWKCEKCGLIVEKIYSPRTIHHLAKSTALDARWCEGKFSAFDRRAEQGVKG